VKFVARRLLENKPYWFVASEKDAWKIGRELLRVQLARFFHCSPAEFDAVPEQRLITWLGIVEAMVELESEQNAGR